MQLTGIFVYPVKSARGIALEQARLGDRGLEHDRRFMIVDAHGHFVTQREQPALARLETAIADGALRLRWADDALQLPLVPQAGGRCRVRLFGEEVEALELPEARAFLSAALKRESRLVYMPDEVRRPVDPTRAAAGDVVGFADGFPYLLANESSLAALNSELAQPVTMARFRPNFVVSGLPAYAEDQLRELEIGALRFLALKPCSRCVIVDTDPEAGVRDPGPLAALARTHKLGNRPIFGQNLVARGVGSLRLGDHVRVTATL